MATSGAFSSAAGQPHFTDESAKPGITIMQTERTVLGYGITEDELEHVGTLNSQATIFFSVFAGLLTLAIGLVTDWLMEGQPANYGEILARYGAPLCFLISLVFLYLAISAVRARGSIVKRIRRQSRVISP